MSRFIRRCGVLLAIILITNSALANKTIDKILMFVNNSIITSQDLDNQIDFYRFNNSIKTQIDQNIKDNILEQLVTSRLELDLAKKDGVNVTNDELNTALDSYLKQQNLDKKQLSEKLNSYGITFDKFIKFLKEQIAIEKIKQKNIDARVFISEEEVNRILNSESFKSRIDYNLSYILINIPENASSSVYKEKKQIVIKALNELKRGDNFSDVSSRYSNVANAINGGNIGWKSNIVLPPQIANALKVLSKNQNTDIIELPVGFMIFRINDIRSFYTKQMLKQYHVHHILIKVNENRSNSEALKQINQLYQQLSQVSNNRELFVESFTKLAKKYSEDASSINGGDIGFVGKSDTVPTFEAQVVSLPLYKLSSPIKTPFGWHILYVDDTNITNKTTEIEKATIRQELRELKATLLYVEWLRNLRDSAYITQAK
jgi:peptidyl-prolyl cis-trans isomerase SurA